MNSNTPSAPLSEPTHDPNSDSSNAMSLSVYRGLSESTGTQPVSRSNPASDSRNFFMGRPPKRAITAYSLVHLIIAGRSAITSVTWRVGNQNRRNRDGSGKMEVHNVPHQTTSAGSFPLG